MVVAEPVSKFALAFGPHPRHNPSNKAALAISNVNFWYGDKQALVDINLNIYQREVAAFLGPSGCGKTTLLRCLNRTAEIIPSARMTGTILLNGEDIYNPKLDPPLIRRRFGWIAQKPDPFPDSVYENIAYGARLHAIVWGRAQMDEHVYTCLRRANLWDEVKDRLYVSALDLSGGQQQRLCIARALSINPEVLLMDEPASALDPTAASKLEELILELREKITIVLITHNLQQAARLAQRIAYFHLGRLLEAGDAEKALTTPSHPLLLDYIHGRLS